MNTTYVIHTHSTTWAHDQEGNPLVSEHQVIEFLPIESKPSYWFFPECVGTFSPACTACGTTDLGEVTTVGFFTDEDSMIAFLKDQMGDRWDYNDRLRANAYYAIQAAKGE